jgi:hypothetical protein
VRVLGAGHFVTHLLSGGLVRVRLGVTVGDSTVSLAR